MSTVQATVPPTASGVGVQEHWLGKTEPPGGSATAHTESSAGVDGAPDEAPVVPEPAPDEAPVV